MMIEVAGKQFRTLEDDLYVNGKKVEEAWLDPVDVSGRRYLVYPEANYTYMKIAGAANVHGHQHPADDDGNSPGESNSLKPLCNGLESDIEASAVMVMHTDRIIDRKRFHFRTSGGYFRGGNRISSGKQYYSETSRSTFLTPSMGQEFNSGIYYFDGNELTLLNNVMATIGLRIKPRKMQFCSYEFSYTGHGTLTIIPESNPDTRHYSYLHDGTITPDDPELMERITQAFTISYEFTAKPTSITGVDTNGKEIKRFPKRDIYSDGIREGKSRIFARLISELEDDVTMPYTVEHHATHISVHTDLLWGYAEWVRCYVQGVTSNGNVVNGYYYIRDGISTVHVPIPLQELISSGYAVTEDDFAIQDDDYITP